MTIRLNKKNEEIFKHIHSRDRAIIINSILSKYIDNGDIVKELSFYLPKSEVEEIIEKMNLEDFVIKKKHTFYDKKNKEKRIIKKEIEKAKKKQEESETLMVGFD